MSHIDPAVCAWDKGHDRVPVAGDFGRNPHAWDVCRICGTTWIARTGEELGVLNPLTGAYSGPARPIQSLNDLRIAGHPQDIVAES